MEGNGMRRPLPRRGSCERARRANRCIGELLLELGVAPHTEGFTALCKGSMVLTAQGESRLRLNDTLYPLVQRGSEKTGISAEHAIRDAIRNGWQREPSALRAKLFPSGRAPTNAEVLYTLAAYAQAALKENRRS